MVGKRFQCRDKKPDTPKSFIKTTSCLCYKINKATWEREINVITKCIAVDSLTRKSSQFQWLLSCLRRIFFHQYYSFVINIARRIQAYNRISSQNLDSSTSLRTKMWSETQNRISPTPHHLYKIKKGKKKRTKETETRKHARQLVASNYVTNNN